MKSIILMAVLTATFACSQACYAHPVMASYEDCVGDMQASWEGDECTWVRNKHPAYELDAMLDSVIHNNPHLYAKVIIVYDPDEGVAKPIVVIE